MAVKILTSGSELVSLADAKAHLRVDFADEDTLIADKLKAAREWAEMETGRAFIGVTAEEYKNTFPCCSDCGLHLEMVPSGAVSKIEYIAVADAADRTYTEWPTTEWWQDSLSIQGRIFPHSGKLWPTIAAVPFAVRITLAAGHNTSNLPAPCKEAMLQYLAFLYENREDMPINERNNPKVRSAIALLKPYSVEWKTS